MSRRIQLLVFVALLAVLAFVLYRELRPTGISMPVAGVFAADAHFHPLDVQEPELHLDALDNLRKNPYSGAHRNIFEAEPLPPPRSAVQPKRQEPVGPRVPPPPPPLDVPVQFFGYASEASSGRRVGFFSSGDDVLVLAQGDTFLTRYRLLSLTNDSAEVLEISSGRRATLPITQPPGEAAN
ncbi:MAG: hypothetical protein KGL02_00430 [Acidobacteriota bacterium]|nr:hypothetical protein [Acidobacteriota bacterium]